MDTSTRFCGHAACRHAQRVQSNYCSLSKRWMIDGKTLCLVRPSSPVWIVGHIGPGDEEDFDYPRAMRRSKRDEIAWKFSDSLYKAITKFQGNRLWYGTACVIHDRSPESVDRYLCGQLIHSIQYSPLLLWCHAMFLEYAKKNPAVATEPLIRLLIEHVSEWPYQPGKKYEFRDLAGKMDLTVREGTVLERYSHLVGTNHEHNANHRKDILISLAGEFVTAMGDAADIKPKADKLAKEALLESRPKNFLPNLVLGFVRLLNKKGQEATAS